MSQPIETVSQICMSLKKRGILKVTFDNSIETNKEDIHRNKGINFNELFIKHGLTRINKHHYMKL